MGSRRITVGRGAKTPSTLSPAQQLEVRGLVEEALRESAAEVYRLTNEIEIAKVYISNLSTILRDIRNSVLTARYNTGSVASTLAELIEGFEVSLTNVEHLPPAYGYGEAGHWGNPHNATPGTTHPAWTGASPEPAEWLARIAQEEDDDPEDDPVSRVSDM